MNSSDEVLAARISETYPESRYKSKVFSSQQIWIQHLFDFYRNKKDFFVVIRMHPREFPNKRETITAEQLEVWEEIFRVLPMNFRIDTPADNFSIYDYFDHVQFITTGWSSVALEALFNEIPVVTYDQDLLGYPPELVVTGSTVTEYLHNLEIAETLGRDPTLRENVLRWVVFSYFRGGIRLGGGLQDLPSRTTSRVLGIFGRLLNRGVNQIFARRVKFLDIHIPRQKMDDWKLLK
jgi:hypothetical protein